MRPVLMATGKPGVASGGGGGGGGGGGTPPPVTFNPVPGEYFATEAGYVDFAIAASASVVWNWSSVGTVPSSTLANGASGTSITFSLSAPAGKSKGCAITVTVGSDEWIIHLSATDPNL